MRQEYLQQGIIFWLSFFWTISSLLFLPQTKGYRAVWVKYICVQLKYRLTHSKKPELSYLSLGWRPSRGWEWIHNKQSIEMVVCLFIDEEKRYSVKMVAFCSRRGPCLGRSKPAPWLTALRSQDADVHNSDNNPRYVGHRLHSRLNS